MSSMSMDFANLNNNNPIGNPSEFLSVEKLWDIKNYDRDMGIGASYKVPAKNINLRKQKEDRERSELFDNFLKGRARIPSSYKKYDDEGKLIIHKRGNYFEDQAKLKDYGFDKEELEKLTKHHKSYKRKFITNTDVVQKVKVVKSKEKSPLYKHNKEHYLNEMERSEKKKSINYPHMENEIKKIKLEIEKENKMNVKLSGELIKEKYKKKGSFS